MATFTKEELIAHLSALSVMEIADLVKSLEDTWGVKAAAAAVAVAAAPSGDAAPAAEVKTEFDVILSGFDEAKKIAVLKEVRGITGLGLKEAKDLVESAPKALKEAVSKDEAENIKKTIEAAGGKVDIK